MPRSAHGLPPWVFGGTRGVYNKTGAYQQKNPIKVDTTLLYTLEGDKERRIYKVAYICQVPNRDYGRRLVDCNQLHLTAGALPWCLWNDKGSGQALQQFPLVHNGLLHFSRHIKSYDARNNTFTMTAHFAGISARGKAAPATQVHHVHKPVCGGQCPSCHSGTNVCGARHVVRNQRVLVHA